MRDFANTFRRIQAGPWAADAAPVNAQVLNVPGTGVGNMYRMPILVGDLTKLSMKFQGYFTSSVGGLTILSAQLYIAAGDGLAAGDWIAVGDPLAPAGGIAQKRLFVTAGFCGDADAVIAITPSAALAGAGDTLTLYLEAFGS